MHIPARWTPADWPIQCDDGLKRRRWERLINKIQNCVLQLCAIIGYFTPRQVQSPSQSAALVSTARKTSRARR